MKKKEIEKPLASDISQASNNSRKGSESDAYEFVARPYMELDVDKLKDELTNNKEPVLQHQLNHWFLSTMMRPWGQ